MSSVIATVQSIVGQVFAVSADGARRLLVEGDRLFKGEEVLTGDSGMVTLKLADGRTLDLGRDSQWSESDARLVGSLEGTSEPVFRDGELVAEERYLASSLNCGACELQLHNIEELLLAEVQPHYTLTVHTDLHEFFEPDESDFYMNM